jgi:DNA-binding protein H-NS
MAFEPGFVKCGLDRVWHDSDSDSCARGPVAARGGAERKGSASDRGWRSTSSHDDCGSIGTLRTLPMREETTVDQRKRDSMVAYLCRRMAEFGISVDDVAAAIAQDQIRQRAARYRSATGQAWSGAGEMPQWLKQAISAGQSLEHFAVDGSASQPESALRRNTDWREDPFAGTRLAMGDHAYGHAR